MAHDIATKIEDWRKRLLDLTKRNRLINCRIGTRGVVRLEHPSTDTLWRALLDEETLTFVSKKSLIGEDFLLAGDEDEPQLSLFGNANGEEGKDEQDVNYSVEECLKSPRLEDNDILTELSDKRLGNWLNRQALNAKTFSAEQGLHVLFVGFGLLRWYENDTSEVSFLSPLLLLPVELASEGVTAPWKMTLHEDDVVGNHSLRELFKKDFRLTLPEPDYEALIEQPGLRSDYLESVRSAIISQQRWEVLDEAVIGQFSFQKLAMYEDYGKNSQAIAQHDHCRRIAGEDMAVSDGSVSGLSPNDFDAQVHPKQIHSILPCDSSQLDAILAAKNGVSMVLDGPPGTGKSQTIANVIAEAIVDGKKVLFVSEKAAALEVVRRRLAANNLGDFVLNCHSHKSGKQEVIEELGRCLRLPVESYPDHSSELDKLYSVRAEINAYVAALHRPVGATKWTPHQIHGRLAALGDGPISRWSCGDILVVTEEYRASIVRSLEILQEHRAIVDASVQHAWYGCLAEDFTLTLEDGIKAQFNAYADSLDRLHRINDELAALQLCKPRISIADLNLVVQDATAIFGGPLVPESWLTEDGFPKVPQVHDFVRKCAAFQTQLRGLSEFTAEAIDNSAVLQECARILGNSDDWFRFVRNTGSLTTRNAAEFAAQLAADYRELSGLTRKWSEALEEVGRAIGLPLNNATIGTLSIVKQLATVLLDSGPLRQAWFDSAATQRIREMAARTATVDKELTARKAKLIERLSPVAMEADGNRLAVEIARHQVFWRWLVPDWWRARREIVEFYREELKPTDAEIFRDTAELRRCQRDKEFVAREIAPFETDLVRDNSGNIAWDVIESGLDVAARLSGIVQITPALLGVLCTDGRLNRDRLRRACTTLQEVSEQFETKVRLLSEKCSRVRPDPNERPFQKLKPQEYSAWLETASEAFDDRAVKLQEGVQYFRNDSGVAAGELAARATALVDAKLRRDEIRREFAKFVDILGDREQPELFDWSAVGKCASFVDTLRQAKNGHLSAGDKQLASSPNHREAAARLCQDARRLFTQLQVARDFVATLFAEDQLVAGGVILKNLDTAELAQWLRSRLENIAELHGWLDYSANDRRLRHLGCEVVLAEIGSHAYELEDVVQSFLRRFYRLWLDAAYSKEDALRSFRVEEHHRRIGDFKDLDTKSIQYATGRIRQKLLSAPDRPHVGLIHAPATSELGILQKEVNKKKRHLPLRQLFTKVPTLLLKMKPCLMMSPLAVSTYLNSPSFRFDLVIFDEASQILPWDAIGAIYRGSQLVVAGDQKQLPPSTFFDRLSDDGSGDGDDDDDENLGDYESVLDVLCGTLKRKRLRWHYRSRREPLIAFSNRHFYDDDLVTFPSPDDLNSSTAVRFEHVPTGRWRTKAGYNPIEAERVAELIIQHLERHPDATLGVITLNQRQQLAVLDELAKIRSTRDDLEELFSDERSEPFFVKNLENVQGDERDCIILSVAYGPSEDTEQIAMRFGPLNKKGGERRLNVAVTRARDTVTVVSSLRGDQIDLGRTSAVGAARLKQYLDFAEKGPAALAAARTGESAFADSPFEEAVASALRSQGLDVRLQIGCSGFRVDLGIVHPEFPGKFVLGIECDGATYHRTATARDRDRMRQEVLENLGWRIERVWSTDWLRDPKRQLDRLLAAYLNALESGHLANVIPDDETDLERPVIRLRDFGNSNAKTYQDITDVPRQVLTTRLQEGIARYGATPKAELVKLVAGNLGFQRTGTRIRARIESAIDELIKSAEFKVDGDDRIAANSSHTHRKG